MVFCAGVVYPWLQKDLFLGVDAKSSIVTADRFHKDPRHERLQPRHAYGKGAACGGGAQLAPPVIASDFGAIRSRRHRVDARYDWRSELRSEEHTSELQSHLNLVCRLLLEKKKNTPTTSRMIVNSPYRTP